MNSILFRLAREHQDDQYEDWSVWSSSADAAAGLEDECGGQDVLVPGHDREDQDEQGESSGADEQLQWSGTLSHQVLVILIYLLIIQTLSTVRFWRQEWEKLYPDSNIDWKQVVDKLNKLIFY